MSNSSEQAPIVERFSLSEAVGGQTQDWWTVIEPEGDRAMIVLAQQEHPGALSMILRAMTAYTGDSITLGEDNRPTGNFIAHTTLPGGHEVRHFEPRLLGRAIIKEISPPLLDDKDVRREAIRDFVTAAWVFYETDAALDASIEIARSYPPH